MQRFFLSVLLLTLAGFPACGSTLEGQRFEERASLASHELQLNGLGVRAAYIFKAFVAALYLPQRSADPQDILGQDMPRRLQLRMLMTVDSNEIRKALVRGMRKNVEPQAWAGLQERVNQFAHAIDTIGTAREGDTINLDYLPGRGLLLEVNDLPRGPVIAGADFYRALLEIFVGPNPVDTRLKKGLLGH
ncbi:MAG: chalcone isomerase family protein [Curvibacter sp.]|jgi:hypothetical protein|nr:chalcone isomerase family protein [Curvibacter sp.]